MNSQPQTHTTQPTHSAIAQPTQLDPILSLPIATNPPSWLLALLTICVLAGRLEKILRLLLLLMRQGRHWRKPSQTRPDRGDRA